MTDDKWMQKWLARLSAAHTMERQWREECDRIYQLYMSKDSKRGYDSLFNKTIKYNILWSNTETLRPSIYNSSPVPDVRRRFKDKDPLGKACSEALNRALTYLVEMPQFETSTTHAVLDMLLCGRGVLWVRYEAEFQDDEETILKCEKVYPEIVQWDDFRHGEGERWSDVTWVGRRIRMGKAELKKMFGDEMAEKIPLDDIESTQNLDPEAKGELRTAAIWEIWDKESKKRFYLHEMMTDAPLSREDVPLDFSDFFPCPMPAHAIEDSTGLVPIPLYRQYRAQAEELNEVTCRIQELVKVVKIRGLYHPQITEIEKILDADNTALIPIENMSAIVQVGGMDKAIWMMPIEMIVQTLTALYQIREQCKQAIYEITGISDILRGSSNANETLGAQQIKAQWGTMRLQRMQRETQRLFRDAIRMMAEVVAERFDPATLKAMTQLDYPSMQDKQMMQLQQRQLLETGQPPTPQMMRVQISPTWEEIIQVLRSDEIRSYKIDIETDSTIAEGLNRDMESMSMMMKGLSEYMSAMGPAIQSGMMSPEAAKEIFGAVIRRARLGTIVEDAMDDAEIGKQPQDEARLTQMKDQIGQIIEERGGQLAQKSMEAQRLQQATQQSALQAQQAIGTVAQTQSETKEISIKMDRISQSLDEMRMAIQALMGRMG